MLYFSHSWEDKGVNNFPKGICPNVNVIAQLEYNTLGKGMNPIILPPAMDK